MRAAMLRLRPRPPCRLPGLAAARTLCTATTVPPPSAAPQTGTILGELERLENGPWWKSGILRLVGTFSEAQKQAAAGCDLFMICREQAKQPELYSPEGGGLEDRYYRRFQAEGLHHWLAFERLRQEPKETHEHLTKEMMEKVWDKATLDLSDQGMDYIKLSKHIKEMQFNWHGVCRLMDESLNTDTPRDSIVFTLLRNLYGDEGGTASAEHEASAQRLANYVLAQRVHLRTIPAERVLRGEITWGAMDFSAPQI